MVSQLVTNYVSGEMHTSVCAHHSLRFKQEGVAVTITNYASEGPIQKRW